MMKMITLALSLISLNLMAQDAVTSDDLALADEVIESPTLDINGKLSADEVIEKKATTKKAAVTARKRPLTSSEKLQLYRAQLEERNRMMVQKKIEEIRLKQEIALMKQLESSMNQTLKNLDTVK